MTVRFPIGMPLFLIVSALFWLAQSIDPTAAQPLSPKREAHIQGLLSQMTLREKISLMSGKDGMSSHGIPRLNIPALQMANGPLGVGGVPATYFGAGISFAATWDTSLIYRVGQAIGGEARHYGKQIILGPCVNIQRLPIGGRNFESYSEDPFLSAQMAVAWISGVQSQKVAACVKHFVCNDQEFQRNDVNVVVDERTLREIYLPPFRAAVQKAHALTVMAAYNRVNGYYATANRRLLTDILKKEWGFSGLVMSDWDATHSTVGAALAGLDMEMPGPPRFFGDSLAAAVRDGRVPRTVIDEHARRILRVMARLGLLDENTSPKSLPLDTLAHRKLAREVAEESVVLLKNQNHQLPLNRAKIKSLALIGPWAEEAYLAGGGSSSITPFRSQSLVQAFRQKLGSHVQIRSLKAVTFVQEYPAVPSRFLLPPEGMKGLHGVKGEYFNNLHLKGKPVITRLDRAINFNWGKGSPDKAVHPDRFSARWTGKLVPPKSGFYRLGVKSNDGSRLFVNGKLFVNNWGNHDFQLRSKRIFLEKGKPVAIKVEYFEVGNVAGVRLEWEPDAPETIDPRALTLAGQSDVAILCVGLNHSFEGEGLDRAGMDLPGAQNKLIREVARVQKHTIVLLFGGTPVTMTSWVDSVPAILDAFYPGQEGAAAIVDILLGDANPSGKLPVTFPAAYKDNPTFPFFPGTNDRLVYGEKIWVGYRYYDTRNIEPLFPFGFGLSYTHFTYSDLNLSTHNLHSDESLRVNLNVTNSGKRAGDEVVQLYVRDEKARVPREFKALKGFSRVHLLPGETKAVHFKISPRDLAFYDVGSKRWVTEPGWFQVRVGSSSRDIRLTRRFRLEK
ncbi:MAG: hypothetical protein GXO76_01435 [Calditrichaeota bacterium]|nr:hypothetical protein [Calditrichota bacterium]